MANKRPSQLTQITAPTAALSYVADSGTGDVGRVTGEDMLKKTPIGTATTGSQNLGDRIDYEKQLYWSRPVTATSYTLVVTGQSNDLGEELRFSANSAISVTVPRLDNIPNYRGGIYAPGADNARAGWILTCKILLAQRGTGNITLVAGSGVAFASGSQTSTTAVDQVLDLEYTSPTSVRVRRYSGAGA